MPVHVFDFTARQYRIRRVVGYAVAAVILVVTLPVAWKVYEFVTVGLGPTLRQRMDLYDPLALTVVRGAEHWRKTQTGFAAIAPFWTIQHAESPTNALGRLAALRAQAGPHLSPRKLRAEVGETVRMSFRLSLTGEKRQQIEAARQDLLTNCCPGSVPVVKVLLPDNRTFSADQPLAEIDGVELELTFTPAKSKWTEAPEPPDYLKAATDAIAARREFLRKHVPRGAKKGLTLGRVLDDALTAVADRLPPGEARAACLAECKRRDEESASPGPMLSSLREALANSPTPASPPLALLEAERLWSQVADSRFWRSRRLEGPALMSELKALEALASQRALDSPNHLPPADQFTAFDTALLRYHHAFSNCYSRVQIGDEGLAKQHLEAIVARQPACAGARVDLPPPSVGSTDGPICFAHWSVSWLRGAETGPGNLKLPDLLNLATTLGARCEGFRIKVLEVLYPDDAKGATDWDHPQSFELRGLVPWWNGPVQTTKGGAR